MNIVTTFNGKKIKYYLLLFLPVLLISLFTMWPSFNLHLTGDDYLGLWRYRYYLEGHTQGTWNNFSFLFTDYGPQDTITAIIHFFFGFDQPRIYYIVSYLLRLLAAFSFFPIIKYITGNNKTAYISVLFFTVCSTGLETTDWSFNMPSYIAIALLNVFLLYYLKGKQTYSIGLTLLSAFLFYLVMVAQPIRMTFLPVFVVLLELYTIVRKPKLNIIKMGALRIGLFIGVGIFFYMTGFVGNSVGAGETFEARVLQGGWLKVVGNNMAMIKPFLERGEYQVLAYPITQLGSVIFPTHLIPTSYQLNTVNKALFKLSIPFLFLFATTIILYQSRALSTIGDKLFTSMSPKQRKNKRAKQSIWYFIIPLILATMWTVYGFTTFVFYAQYPFNKSQFISLLLGGYAVIFLGYLFVKNARDEKIAQGIFLATLLTVLAYVTPWSRNPTFLFETTGRYLIVPAAGLTLIVGLVIGAAKDMSIKVLTYTGVFAFFAMHMYASHAYIYHLSTVRGIEMTDSIRKSIPNVKNFDVVSEPKMFFVEPRDSEILHHALIFGFPVIIGAQYDFFNVWQNALTDRWEEVEAAYKDGSSLKRFSIPVQKVKLENIYSFRLEGNTLVDTTVDTRRKLKEQFPEKPLYTEQE